MENLSVNFSNRIRELRKSNRMSQEELAFNANISAAHLGQIERAEKSPTLGTIGKLADAFGVPIQELFTFESSTDLKNEDDVIMEKIQCHIKALSPEERRDILRIIRIFHRNVMKKDRRDP